MNHCWRLVAQIVQVAQVPSSDLNAIRKVAETLLVDSCQSALSGLGVGRSRFEADSKLANVVEMRAQLNLSFFAVRGSEDIDLIFTQNMVTEVLPCEDEFRPSLD